MILDFLDLPRKNALVIGLVHGHLLVVDGGWMAR